MATALYQSLQPKSDYIDKSRKLPPEEYFRRLDISSTVYIGNLSIYTKEEAIYDLFSRCGQIKLMKMGLNKNSKTPCGFCFIEFATHEEAGYAVDCLSHTYLDDRIIRIDWDIGFDEGRQFGRGKSGGQVRDEFRTYEDPGRGEMVKRENNYRGGHRGNRDYRGGDRRDRGDRDYRGDRGDRRHSGNYRNDRNDRGDRYDRYDRNDRNDRSRNRDEGHSEQHYKRHDSDSDQEDNYRRKKTKGE